MTGATPHATTATRGTAVTIPLRGAAASRAGGHPLCHVLEKNLALFQLEQAPNGTEFVRDLCL